MKRMDAGYITVVTLAVLLLVSPSWSASGSPSLTPKASLSFRLPDARVQIPAGVSTNWWATAQKEIRRSEYRVTRQAVAPFADSGPVWQAPNWAHNLRTYFTADGIRVVLRTEATPSWQWGIRLAGWGYEGHINPLSAVEPVISYNRVEYRRGHLTEWYINDERGLEQGFTIQAPPSTDPAVGNATLALELALSGGLKANLQAGKVSFTTAKGGVRVIDFGALQASDATGRELSARFSLSGAKLAILVDVVGAVYPMTVDPLATSPSWVAEGDQADAQFGWSVSTAGDVNGDGYSDVIVGAPYHDNDQLNEGAVFVYYGSASGLSPTAGWTAEGDQADAYFGRSVSTAGDVNADGYSDVIVGADYFDTVQSDEGAVFVYYGSASGLSPTAGWTAEGDQADAYFGRSVSTAGDVNGDGYSDVIVGAPGYVKGQGDPGAGAVFVYYGSASGLDPDPQGPNARPVGRPDNADWTAESDQAAAHFGYSVSTAGDVNGDGYSDVIVGAQYYDTSQGDEGAVFVYYGSASGLSGTADWTAESDQAAAHFGYSVSTAGDVNGDGYSDVIVGAYSYNTVQSDEGAAFVYYGSATGLGPNGTPGNADWTAEGDQAAAYFGRSVSTAGDVNGDGYSDVIVGADYFDTVQSDEGAAFVYYGSASGLDPDPQGPNARPVGRPDNADWTAESDQAAAHFGYSLSTAGDVNGDGFDDVIVGVPGYGTWQDNVGLAIVYYYASGVSPTADWTAESDQAAAHFGYSVSTAGDVNGDGFDDVIMVAPYYFNSSHKQVGAAFVYYGSATGLGPNGTPGNANWVAEGDMGTLLGKSMSPTAGDVNGDGFDDVIVGSDDHNTVYGAEGAVFVYYGSADPIGLGPNGTPDNADWRAEGDQVLAHFGTSVSIAGDVHGDGFDDVIVGWQFYTNDQYREGGVFLYDSADPIGLGPNGTPGNADWTAEGDQENFRLGLAVSTAGDVNGDGYSDVIVTGGSGSRQVLVYHGSATGLGPNGTPGNADWTAEGDQASSSFGWSVSTAGDVNGDGFDDVIIGDPYYSSSHDQEGAAFVYYGSATGLGPNGTPGNADWTAEGDVVMGRFGYSVSTAGDVNGDGYSDVIVGAPGIGWGHAFVYYGSATGLGPNGTPGNADWTIGSQQRSPSFGDSVSTAGDVNGDGYDDVIVGVPGYVNAQGDSGAGAAFVYYGSLDPYDPSSVSAAVRRLLFPEDALPGQEDAAAFRYVRKLYEKDQVSNEVAPQFENMPLYYGHTDFDRSVEAEDVIRLGLLHHPLDPALGELLLDIYYRRTEAAQILAEDLLKPLEEVRLGITGEVPDACTALPLTPVIDREICVLEQALEAHRWALQGGIDADTAMAGGGYFHLLQDDLGVVLPGYAPLGYRIFQVLVPGRDLEPPMYWDPDSGESGEWVPVGGSPDPLFTGYKDMVLLFGLLRDTGRMATRLAPLYAARGDLGDQELAKELISSTQRLLLTQGQILLDIFPGMENDASPESGVIEAIAAWRQALNELTTVAQLVRADKNPLGFDEDFLVFMAKPGGAGFEGLFDSFDLFEAYLDPLERPSKPLGVAIEALDAAGAAYETYQGSKNELDAQLDLLYDNSVAGLIEIVGCSPDDPEYDDAKADPKKNAPWGEVGQQLLSIEKAVLAIERNRQEVDNLRRQVQIEVERQGAVGSVYINYGEKQAKLTEEIGRLEAAQAAADACSSAFHGVVTNPYAAATQIAIGVGNAGMQAGYTALKSEIEGEKERQAAKEKAEIEGIDSAARIKAWLLEMNVLVIDSQESALLLAQERARLKGLINEVERLETRLKEANFELSRRYFADPIHRLRAEGDVRRANFSFESSQRWIFFMARALEYKWNETFEVEWPEGSGRTWTMDDVFRCRNAEELYDAYLAMDEFDSDFVYGGNSFDILSLRQDILGFLDGGLYDDPLNPGTLVDAVTAFRNYIKSVSATDDNGELYIFSFSTAREFPPKSLFIDDRYVDKIDKLLVAVVGDDASSESQLVGSLTYGGTSYIRRQRIGQVDPLRPDKFQDELTTYSTRFWTEDVDAQKFVSQEAQTVSIDVQVNPTADLACDSYTVGEITSLRERSVATSGWQLKILNPEVGGVPVLNVDNVDDIKIHICHNWKDRLPPQ